MPLSAIIFDIDGTLVDSNPAHVEAWHRSFADHGYDIAPDRIKVEIGKGGDKLVPDLIGDEADQRDGDALRDAEPRHFAKIVAETGLKLFPGARELVAAVRERGLAAVVATSSGKDQLKALEKAAGIDLESMFDVLATADDAEQSKPDPDIVLAALHKAKVPARHCALIGDTLYDMQAARKAGVIPIGVLTGYQPRHALEQAGARQIFDNTAHVLGHLDALVATA